MEEKSHSINRTDNMNREPGTTNTTNTTGNQTGEERTGEDTGITPGQLSNIQRNPSSRGAGSGSATKPFITGTDSDGQL